MKDCDNGYDIIELGQNDGFIPCQCEECYNLYGIKPTHTPADGIAYNTDPAWGEKLWIMHRDMALRLKKDRPGKKLMVSAYAVAQNPPLTIKEFPDNMMVQLMHPVDRLKDWPTKIKVPAGYGAYLYTWGTFHVTGYTPIRSNAHIKELVDHLVKYNIRMIQNNGMPFSYGIEGVNIYAYRRVLNDPEGKSVGELQNEYLEAAYKEAAVPMKVFYRKLHQRLNFMPEAMNYSRENRNPLLAFATIYTSDLMVELEKQLLNAERLVKSENAKRRLGATRYEFDFLKHIVDTMYLYQVFQLNKNQQTLDAVIAAVEARNQHICDAYPRKDRPSFAYRRNSALINNGRYFNIEPYNWNLDEMRSGDVLNQKKENKRLTVTKATKAVSIDSDIWKKASVYELVKNLGSKEDLVEKTTFQVAYDNKNLYVRFEAGLPAEHMDSYYERGKDQELWLQECLNICLAPAGDKSQYYYLNFEPIANSYSDANHGFITDVLHPKFGWNDDTWDGDWTYENKLVKEENKWIAFVTLPYKTFKAPVPKKGDMWFANFGRVHFKEKLDNASRKKMSQIRELSVWAEKINISKTPGDGYFGEIIFE